MPAAGGGLAQSSAACGAGAGPGHELDILDGPLAAAVDVDDIVAMDIPAAHSRGNRQDDASQPEHGRMPCLRKNGDPGTYFVFSGRRAFTIPLAAAQAYLPARGGPRTADPSATLGVVMAPGKSGPAVPIVGGPRRVPSALKIGGG